MSPGEKVVLVVRLTLWLMTMALISGISRLDLRGWMRVRTPGRTHGTRCVCVWRGVLPVVGPLGPHLLHILRRQNTKAFSCFSFFLYFLAGVLNGAPPSDGSHLLDQLAPAPSADLSVASTQQVGVSGQQAEDGTFVSCGGTEWVTAANS